MNKAISFARMIVTGMAAALLVAALTPAAASAGQKTDGQEKTKKPSHGIQDTGMATPSDMSSAGMTGNQKGNGKEKVIKADNMDKKKLKAQLDAASDDTVIEYKGKKKTKKELKAEAAKRDQEAQAAMKSAPSTPGSNPDAVIAQFNQQEKAKLDAANMKVRAEMTRLIRLNPAVEGAAGQANPAAGAPVQRRIGAPIQSAPVEQNVR